MIIKRNNQKKQINKTVEQEFVQVEPDINSAQVQDSAVVEEKEDSNDIFAGFDFSEVKIPAIYSRKTLEKSHYRPIVDTFRFTMMNTRLFFASVFFSKKMLKKISLKK